jgi:methyltransferase (TIGR00027 family)
VQNDQASRTALLIAASLITLHHHPKHPGLISKTAAEFCGRVLETYSAETRLLSKIARQGWFRAIARIIEHTTVPGILLHYALRKKCIAKLARAALANGATQVAVIGAGFDPLSSELQQDFPRAEFCEIDHPATQRHKVRACSEIGIERLHFVAADLSAGLDSEALIKSSFDPTQRTFWIAEGLLMYLPGDTVSLLMRTLAGLSARGSQFAFTFMEKGADGRVRFDSQTKLVDWWLRKRGEPFVWGSTRTALVDVVRPWQIIRFFDHDDLRKERADEPIAKGEVICLAEI